MHGRLVLKHNDAMPRDLRIDPDWEPRFVPIDPEAHRKLRECLQKNKQPVADLPSLLTPAEEITEMIDQTMTEEMSKEEALQLTIDEIRQLFDESLARAIQTQRQTMRGRRYGKVFTPQVCDYLFRKHLKPDAPFPMTIEELSQKNGFIQCADPNILRRQMVRFGHLPHSTADTETNKANLKHALQKEDPPALVTVAAAPSSSSSGSVTAMPLNGLNFVTLPTLLAEPLPAEFVPLVNALGQIVEELNNVPGVKAKAAVTFEWEVS